LLKVVQDKLNEPKAKSKTKDTSPDVIVLDDPFEFKGIRKVLPPLIIRYTYVDDVAVEFQKSSSDKTEESSRKKKVRVIVPRTLLIELILTFRASPSSPRYAPPYSCFLHLTFLIPGYSINHCSSRGAFHSQASPHSQYSCLRRRTGLHSSELVHFCGPRTLFNNNCLDNPERDVAQEVYDRSAQIAASDKFLATDPEMLKRRIQELKRQSFICGYKLKHFLALRDHFIKELEQTCSEDLLYDDQDAEMCDDEMETRIVSFCVPDPRSSLSPLLFQES
jgi:hypothetical protein